MSFMNTLSKEDLARLRMAVRKVHLHYFPDGDVIPNEQVDMMIETFGQEVVENNLKACVDSGLIEKKIQIVNPYSAKKMLGVDKL